MAISHSCAPLLTWDEALGMKTYESEQRGLFLLQQVGEMLHTGEVCGRKRKHIDAGEGFCANHSKQVESAMKRLKLRDRSFSCGLNLV
jgi:hypothetical protein